MIREEDFKMLCKKAKQLQLKGTQECDKKIPNSLVLKLTTSCNIACKYCYMGDSSKANEQMSAERALQIIEKFDKLSTMPLTVYLHGGEPCMRIDLIKEIGNAIENHRFQNKIMLMLQTNGTLFTNELIQMIKRYNINVGISLDGMSEESNAARIYKNNTNTLMQVINGIRALIDEGISVGIFSVLTRYNVFDMQESMQQLTEMGVKSFVVNPLVLWGRASRLSNLIVSKEEMVECYKKIIDWIGEHNARVTPENYFTERNIHWWYYAIKFGIKGYMCNCSPCGAGIQTLAFSTKGDIYLCDQYYGDENFYLGNIFEHSVCEILGQVQKIDMRNVFEIEECMTCKWRFVCCGGCSANAYYHSGSMKSIAPHCNAYKEILEYIDTRVKEGIIL